MNTYRVTAINTAVHHENKIHSDEVAARYGFRGGLVPGVNIYGYMTVPVIASLGEAWLRSGWMRVRFDGPFYEGETVVTECDGQVAKARGETGEQRASAEVGLGGEEGEVIPAGDLPVERPVIGDAMVRSGMVLGSIHARFEAPPTATELLSLSNDVLVRNFVMSAWVHVSSHVRNHQLLGADETLEVRARIADVFERKGHKFLTAEVCVLDSGGRLAQSVRHAAIWALRSRAQS